MNDQKKAEIIKSGFVLF